jgi:hypothetical protein
MYSKLAVAALAVCAATLTAADGVKIEARGGGYELLREGKPYFIKGAGGSRNLDVLINSGGNSIRTWGISPEVLDQAQAKGLTVLAGLRVALPRNGFDYGNREAVSKQLEETRQTVLKLKDHPALLMWALGNEVELRVKTEDRPRLWSALEEMAKLVKKTDSRHPVIIVLAGIGGGKLAELKKYCPSIDAVGINAYGSMLTVPEVIAAEGWTKPYVVTEFGPRGHWEVAKTPWGLPIEDNSTQKADFYLKAYQHTVSGQPRCLGSYVFLWDQKQEKTHTWYGMFLPGGNRTASVDALAFAWTGKWPANRCPRIGSEAIKLLRENADADDGSRVFAPGTRLTSTIDAADPEGGPLTIRWDLRRDVSDAPQTGGDREQPTQPIESAVISTSGNKAFLRLPEIPANYRIFVYVFDSAGNAATANVPIQVK